MNRLCSPPQHNRLSVLPDVLVDERAHLLERLLCDWRREIAQQTFALLVEDVLDNLATSLAVLSDELLAVWGRMRRLVAASLVTTRNNGPFSHRLG